MSDTLTDTRDPAIKSGMFGAWNRLPLFVRILIGMVLGIGAGFAFGENAVYLKIPSTIILRVLGALAPPLIFVAVINVLLTTELKGRVAWRLAGLLILNTVVAIAIGLAVANVVRPGAHTRIPPPTTDEFANETPQARAVLQLLKEHGFKPDDSKKSDPFNQLLDNVPKSLLGPLGDDGSVIGVIFIAMAFGIALRTVRERKIQTVGCLVEVFYHSLLVVLNWVIAFVPLGVFGIVASIVGGKRGFELFMGLAAFIVAVIVGLALQGVYYLLRVRLGTWVRPLDLVRGCRDALVMAFSTGSSTATMPVTYANLRERVGLREESASLGALVGTNFNNDGTALYEAMSALFISQMLVSQGIMEPLSLSKQLIVVLTSIIASVGAAGIPEAGLVTMTLVFKAVGLPTEYIALLLTVDWFLDRCRTAINVMGDMNVSCMLDGRVREVRTPAAEIVAADSAAVAK